MPRLKTLKLEDDAITIDVIHSLTIEPHQPPLLPMLEEMEFNSIEGDPQMVADMTGSRCGLLDTESCHSLRSVRFGCVRVPPSNQIGCVALKLVGNRAFR